MLVVLPFYSGDAHLAKKNLEWMLQLDRSVPFECVLSCDTQTDAKEVTALAEKYFSKVHQFRYNRSNRTDWPHAQNNAFMNLAWHMHNHFQKHSFLWAETDAVPLHSGWLQAIADCHAAGKKPFTGHWNFTTGVFNGVAVYPANISRYAPNAMTATLCEGRQPPWDVYCSKQVEKHLNKANHLFQHIWHDNATQQACTFPTRQSVRDAVRPGVVLFHRSKDHSITQWRDEIEDLHRHPLVMQEQPTHPSVTLIYVYPASGFEASAARFVDTYRKCPPEYAHSTVIVVNGGNVTHDMKQMFSPLAPSYFLHDNSGWDIGAFLAIAPHIKSHAVLCCGANSHFKKAGWLKRYIQIWRKMGPGMYGTVASNEVRPHLCTNGFATAPGLLAEYPHKVETLEDRYEFEWGKGAFWRRVNKAGLPVKMITWDGVWGMDQLRVPPNIYRRGDQSNCLVYFRHSDAYDAADEATKKRMAGHADDPPKQICALQQRVDAVSRELVPI